MYSRPEWLALVLVISVGQVVTAADEGVGSLQLQFSRTDASSDAEYDVTYTSGTATKSSGSGTLPLYWLFSFFKYFLI